MKNYTIRVRRVTVFGLILALLYFSNLVNIGNYSFLSNSFSGVAGSNPLFLAIKYSRLPLLLAGAFVVFHQLIQAREVRSYFIANADLLLLGGVMYLGLFNALDVVNGLFYTVWHSAVFVVILYFFYILKRDFTEKERVLFFFRFLFWSNFIVIPLLIINMRSLFANWSYDMAFSNQTFYPYCLLSIMAAMYGARVLGGSSVFKSKWSGWFELVLVGMLIFFTFVSARRTPLFLMVFMTLFFSFYAVGRRMWKRVFLFVVLAVTLVISIPKGMKYMYEHRYELSMLKKINDIQESGGELSKDASYNERGKIWKSYLVILERNALFGTGSYNSTLWHKHLFKSVNYRGYSTHNLYRGALIEHGYIGFSLLLFVILRSVWILLMRSSLRFVFRYGTFVLLPVLLVNWNEYNLIPGQVFYWTTMLVILFPRSLKIR